MEKLTLDILHSFVKK